jgi:hypothetical protein
MPSVRGISIAPIERCVVLHDGQFADASHARIARRPGPTLLCMGLFSRFFVQPLPCTVWSSLRGAKRRSNPPFRLLSLGLLRSDRNDGVGSVES